MASSNPITQVVIINSGSSSIKFAIYDRTNSLQKRLTGIIENIHIAPSLKIFDPKGGLIKQQDFAKNFDYQQFFELLITAFEKNQFNFTISAVGHRVAHGGSLYRAPLLVTDEVLKYLETLIPFVPLHQPYNLNAIQSIHQHYPNIPQVACFDTAFHHTHPFVANWFGLPRELIDSGVRRYGFHGISYEYILKKFSEMEPDKAHQRLVVAHLGSGASLCAIKEKQSIDSTMGFTALDGLMMGTRCGGLDPGVILYLLQQKHLSAEAIEELLYKKSGLLGVSQLSSNMKTLLENNTQAAKEAIQLYVYRIRHELGAMVAALEGLDALIFTGGIGEKAWQIREAVCATLAWLGIAIDAIANQGNHTMIHTTKSQIPVYVIPTDEEKMIAHHTYHIIKNKD